MINWFFNFRLCALDISELKVNVYCLDYKSIDK